MTTTLDLSGLDRVRARIALMVNPDATPLMVSFMRIIDTDNRIGVLAGTDKDGVHMMPVTYRPVGKPVKPRRRGRGAFQGGMAGNLSSSEYRRLGGPPLAPRGTFSRVITNLRTRFERESAMRWLASGYWDDVVSRRGDLFLRYHFNGATGGGRSRNVTLPRRDLRGVRPPGLEKARRAARAWMIDMIRTGG